MAFFKSRTKKNLNFVRIISAVLVLSVLVLIVAESAKYLNEAKVPKSLSSKIEEPLAKIASVVFSAKEFTGSLADLGSHSGRGKDASESSDSTNSDSLATVVKIPVDKVDNGLEEAWQKTLEESRVAGVADSRYDDSVASFEASPAKVVASIALISDVHNDLDYLVKALNKAKDFGADRVVFLGDYTDWGEVARLSDAKAVMDASGLPYVSLPGDHDLGETRDESNFVKVFGDTYGIYMVGNIKFMYFDNSKNYTKIKDAPMAWFKKEIQDTNFLFLSQPLMTASMSRVMGIINGVKDIDVFSQNNELLTAVRNGKVRVIIAGDLHQFSQFKDPVKADLWHYSVGAVLKTQSLEKLNLQAPRFAILEVKEDLSYKVSDIPID